jgi:hypothetical protein
MTDIEQALEKLRLEAGDTLFVDARTIDIRAISRLAHPIYTVSRDKIGKLRIDMKDVDPGKIIGVDDSFTRQHISVRIIAVFPKDGQSVKECLYAMPAEELKKLMACTESGQQYD